MYGNLSRIGQAIMADVTEKKTKLADGYEFAYKKGDQLGMFHFGG